MPSLQTRGASNVLSQATQAIKQKEQKKIAGEVLERTMKDPRQFRSKPKGKVAGIMNAYKLNPLIGTQATGIREIDKRRKGLLGK